jgi:hypothetical protein
MTGQLPGYIFPNVAKAERTTKYYSATAKHKWHGPGSGGASFGPPRSARTSAI